MLTWTEQIVLTPFLALTIGRTATPLSQANDPAHHSSRSNRKAADGGVTNMATEFRASGSEERPSV